MLRAVARDLGVCAPTPTSNLPCPFPTESPPQGPSLQPRTLFLPRAHAGGIMSPSTLIPVAVLPPYNNPMVSFPCAAWAVTAMVHWRRRSSCISTTHYFSSPLVSCCPLWAVSVSGVACSYLPILALLHPLCDTAQHNFRPLVPCMTVFCTPIFCPTCCHYLRVNFFRPAEII